MRQLRVVFFFFICVYIYIYIYIYIYRIDTYICFDNTKSLYGEYFFSICTREINYVYVNSMRVIIYFVQSVYRFQGIFFFNMHTGNKLCVCKQHARHNLFCSVGISFSGNMFVQYAHGK